jgi:hypothetical protein
MAGKMTGSSQDGAELKIGASVDEASLQKAKREIADVRKELEKTAETDFSPLLDSLGKLAKHAAIDAMKGLAGTVVGGFTWMAKNNLEEARNVLKAAQAGLNNDMFKRWTSVELQLGYNKGQLTETLSSIYSDIARFKSMGKLPEDQALALGLLGEASGKKNLITDFFGAKSTTDAAMLVMDAAFASKKDPNITAEFLKDALGESFASLFYLLNASGKDMAFIRKALLDQAVFTDEASQKKAMGFTEEWEKAKQHIDEMGKLLASTFGGILTGPLQKFNDWVITYQKELKEILTFQEGWFKRLAEITMGMPDSPITSNLARYPSITSGYTARNYLGETSFNSRDAESLFNKKRQLEQLSADSRSRPLIEKDIAELEAKQFRKKLLDSGFLDVKILGNARGYGGHDTGLDMDLVGPLTKGRTETENKYLDIMSVRAFEALLKQGNADRANKLLDDLLDGVKNKTFSGEDYGTLQGFIDEMLKSSSTHGSVQQQNTITLAFPGVTTMEQGEAVGAGLLKGLGNKIDGANSFEFAMVGGYG